MLRRNVKNFLKKTHLPSVPAKGRLQSITPLYVPTPAPLFVSISVIDGAEDFVEPELSAIILN
jgi:hypothetical protein